MDLILFDCDGVLVDSEIIACKVLAAEIGAQIPALDQKAFAAGIFGVTDHDAVRQAEDEYGVTLPDGFVGHVANVIYDRVLSSVEPVTGASDALGGLTLPMAVVSNSPLDRVRRMLDRTGLRPFFDDRLYCAEMVAQPKPKPDVYLLAAERMETAPGRCIAVEDSVAGATAAVAAGMTVIGFLGGQHIQPGHGERLRAAGANQLCQSMAELNATMSVVLTGS